jgi:pantoate--beta-alanine ligase
MRIVNSVAVMQRLGRHWRGRNCKIGFVPTMGYLHAGHISLIARARRLVGKQGKVVVSIYVNPTQFGPGEDLAKYPRDLVHDTAQCRRAGVDVLFVPSDDEMYPSEPGLGFSTYVTEEALSQGMEGASRPSHFRGVTTVVAKLLNIVHPDLAVFGEKDFQQAAVVRRMVRDLNFPTRIVVAPTEREPDGLAMSSRNKYLRPGERAQAVVLWEAIQRARALVRSGRGRVLVQKIERELHGLIDQRPAARLDYISIFDPASLKPIQRAEPGARLALAVFVGRTRLIDNGSL